MPVLDYIERKLLIMKFYRLSYEISNTPTTETFKLFELTLKLISIRAELLRTVGHFTAGGFIKTGNATHNVPLCKGEKVISLRDAPTTVYHFKSDVKFISYMKERINKYVRTNV
jgi:hypothetical protein